MNWKEQQAEFQKEFELIKKFVPAVAENGELTATATVPPPDILVGYIDLYNNFSVSSKGDPSISLSCVIMDKLHEAKKFIDESLEGLAQYQQMKRDQVIKNFIARNEGWCDCWDTTRKQETKQVKEPDDECGYWEGYWDGLAHGKEEKEAEPNKMKTGTFFRKLMKLN